MEVLFLTLNGDGRVLSFPPSAEGVTGYAQAEMLGADPFERLFAEDGLSARATLLSATAERPSELVADLKNRDGQMQVLHWLCWRDGTGAREPFRYLVVAMDRTGEQALEQQALQSARLSAVGVLAAGLAHEIRNPLNGASLHLSVLERELLRLGRLSSSANEALVVVRSELRRLSSLVTDFLEVARPRTLARAQFDMSDVVRAILEQLRDDATRSEIGLVSELPSEPVMAWFDAERIKQALLNLVQNALEAVERKGKIVVRVRPLRDHVDVEVEDDGPGILEGHPPIFDAFFTTKRSGTGLGLSIVHRIVTDHGGDVTYTSVPRRTIFTLRLPAHPQSTSRIKV
jgi:PAS domain S-box-containing protein